MKAQSTITPQVVHRRIGGLENHGKRKTVSTPVHRRIGGLEIQSAHFLWAFGVHRRIGGLEIYGKS